MNKKIITVACGWLLGVASPAIAVTGVDGMSFSGFMTAGATSADKQILPRNKSVSQDGTIENTPGFTSDSRLGVQITAKVNPEITVTGQLLAKASDSNSNLKADWAFLTYRVNEPLSVRAGKIKFPTFLISDYYEVGYAYPWIRPPQEVYSSNPISTINGVDLLARTRIGEGTLLFQPYFGVSRGAKTLVPQEALPMMSPAPAAGSVVYTDFTADKLGGMNLSYGTDIFTVRAGSLKTRVNADAFGVFQDKVKFSSVGFTIDWQDIVLYSESFKREIEGTANAAFPNQKGSYFTFGYRFGKWLPHFTASRLNDNGNPETALGTPLKQTSKTIGLRYELGAAAALKFEIQKVTPEKGTRGLLIANPNATTAVDRGESVKFYGLALDVVF